MVLNFMHNLKLAHILVIYSGRWKKMAASGRWHDLVDAGEGDYQRPDIYIFIYMHRIYVL